jgi:hypothetical protein
MEDGGRKERGKEEGEEGGTPQVSIMTIGSSLNFLSSA